MAQLTAPGSNKVRYTSYPSASGVKDPLFFYCNSTGLERGTLTAIHPGGTGSYDFVWFQWNNQTNSFSIPLKTEAGVSVSSVNDLSEGGYKVEIDSAGTKTSLIGWILFDVPPVAEASLAQQLCNRVALKGKAEAARGNFIYYDPADGAAISLNNEIAFLWSSDPVSAIPYPNLQLNPVTYNPPLEDVTYKLRVNTLGCSNEATFFYKSIHVKADFSVDPVEGEAPLEVNFTDKSIRGLTYTWDFGDDSASTLSQPLPHTYYKPGEYYINLSIESELHCTDIADSIKITVEPSKLDVPNVFTPNGDGYNDNFMVESKSLRNIIVEIYSQSGLKVYSFNGKGEMLKDWSGWDGTINNSSIKASSGIYFYIIRAYGWDDIKYDSKLYRGYVYLYR